MGNISYNKDNVAYHFDKLSHFYDRKKPKYYYRKIKEVYSNLVPKGKTILDIGCGTGEMLHFLKPSYGVGIDLSMEMAKIAKSKYPNYEWYAGGIENLSLQMKFDYIIMIDVIEHIASIKKMLQCLHNFADAHTTIVASWYNPKWELFIRLADFLNLKIPEGYHKIIKLETFCSLLEKMDFKVIQKIYKFLFPVNLFGVSDVLNNISEKIFFLKTFFFTQVVVFRKK